MSTIDITEACLPVVDELARQITLLDQEGRQYAERLLDHYLHNNRGTYAPRCPLGMHSDIANAIRDLVRDEASNIRFHGPRRGTA